MKRIRIMLEKTKKATAALQTISPKEQESLASNQRRAMEQITRATLKNPQDALQAQGGHQAAEQLIR